MNERQWRLEFRKWCVDERDEHRKAADALESGKFRLFENRVDISADWAKRNRQIADELDALIEKIDADLGEDG